MQKGERVALPDQRPISDPDSWTLSATAPQSGRLYLANGYLGTALDHEGGALDSSEESPCYLRGVYDDSGPGEVDRLALIPCWHRLSYDEPAVARSYRRDLDLRRGMLRTAMVLEEARGVVHLEQTILISRADRHQAAVRLSLRPEFDGELTIRSQLAAPRTGQFDIGEAAAEGDSLALRGISPTYGIEIAARLCFEADGWTADDESAARGITRRFRQTVRAGQDYTLTQLARVATSLESATPMEIARREGDDFAAITERHVEAWDRLWRTDIEIDGDPEAQRFARAALFYLWSTMQEDDHWSIAPMGLSSNGYNGHIFWDAELWMYPSLLVTQPDMARSCVAYRRRTLDAARSRAAASGHRGAQFPWEGAFTGEEMTPEGHATRDFQLHVTADVAIGQWWYYLNTGDLAWLRQDGFPVIRACAEYWASRVEYRPERDRYEISNVVCADEYAAHVNNDVFTNAAVRQALLIATRAAEIIGEPAPLEWRSIADRMYIPYDRESGRHPEFDSYDGGVTKQADVELLAYPLEHVTDPAQVARDLDYYAGVIDPNGPAMSFSVYSILSAQLGRARDAYTYFTRSYAPNTRPPFLAFSETPINDEFFFCTGVGGSLQALLFGFTGLRLREDHIILGPILPDHWRALRLRGLSLLGACTDIEIRQDTLTVRRLHDGQPGTVTVHHRSDGIELEVEGEWIDRLELTGQANGRTLRPGEVVTIPSLDHTGPRLSLLTASGECVLDVVVQGRHPIPTVEGR